MKKFFAIFLCIFILAFNTINVKAMDIGAAINVTQDILYESWDMISSLFNGVVIQTSPYAGLANEGAAMAAFYDDWQTKLLGLTQYWGSDPGSVETSAIKMTYPLTYGMSGKTMNHFLTEYANLVQDVSNGFAMPISGNTLATWNRFNNLWISRYLKAFEPQDTVIPNPDSNYQSYLELLNGLGFWSSATVSYYNYTNETPLYFIQDPSICSYIVNLNNLSSGYSITASLNNNNIAYILPVNTLTVDIIGSGDTYSMSLRDSFINYSTYSDCEDNYYHYTFAYDKTLNQLKDNGVVNTYTFQNSYMAPVSIFSRNGTLSQLLQWLSDKTRNITLYVNGELWLYAGTPGESIILAPDVIRNETGQVIGNDVIVPNHELKVDLIGWQNLLEDKISTGEDITLDDVIDAGILVDSDGTIITDENRDQYLQKKSINAVITDELDDTQAIALVPDLPVPPNPGDTDPFNWNFPEFIPDIPDGSLDPRHTGLSVLARIVNVTNQSLPGELISMFWGIVITLVILGIIKIAHK